MSIDFDTLADNMSDYGVSFSADDPILTSKISQISCQFNLIGEQLEDELLAFANNLKKTAVDKALLEAMEIKLQKKLDSELKSAQKIKRPILAEKLQASFHMDTSIAETDISMIEDDKSLVVSELYSQFAPIKSIPHKKYLARENRGTVANEMKGTLFVPNSGSSAIKPQITVLSENANEYYAGDKTANVIDEITERLKTFSDLFRENNPEIGNWTRSFTTDQDIFLYGVIISDSEESEKLHLGNVKIMLDDEAGSSFPLDLQYLSPVTFFPGQIVAFQGSFDETSQNSFIPKKEFFLPKLTSNEIHKKESDFVSIWSACGPFTSSETCGYEPLYDLLESVRKEQPHVLVLMGPFVDRKSKYFTSPHAEATYSQVKDIIMLRIAQFLDKCSTHIILQPSPSREGSHISQYPCPPLNVPSEMVRILGKRLHQVSDPAIVDIDGIRIALTGSEIIVHLGLTELHRSADQENCDRISRLANHLLDQRSLYPLAPPILPTSSEENLKLSKLTSAPHMIITPSVFPSTFKNINGVLVNNPGSYLRGNTGTCSKVDIALGLVTGNSIVDYSHCRIMRV